MLKFFRRIRWKLLNQSSLRKYLVYALGEIILVVIGILIALQINNWNENQELRKKEIQIYKELKSELYESVKDVKGDLSDLKRNLLSTIIVRDLMVRQEFDENLLSQHLPLITDLEHFTPKTSAFESLKSLGFDILSNDSLRQIITNLYQIAINAPNTSDASVEYAKFRDKIASLLEPHLSINRDLILAERGNKKAVADRINDSLVFDRRQIMSNLEKNEWAIEAATKTYHYIQIKDPAAFIHDGVLAQTIQSSLKWRLRVIWRHQSLIDRIERDIRMIEAEIRRLE